MISRQTRVAPDPIWRSDHKTNFTNMKPKQVIIGLIVLLCAGLGVFWLFKTHGNSSGSDGEIDSTSAVVTVQTGKIRCMTLHHYITGYGTVEPAPATASEPAADAPLAAPTAGIVAQVKVAEGEHVKKGEVLMTLNSGTTTASYARQEFVRQKKLYAEHNTSLKSLQNAEALLDALQVVTPLSGTVVSLNVKPGAAVDVNTVAAKVVDLKRLVVRTDIPASQAGELKNGEEMQVLTKPPVTARLSYISSTEDMNNGTVRAWATLSPDSSLRPGQFVPLQIVTAIHTNCLAVPEQSVVTDVNGQSVVSLVQGDQAVRTPVKTSFDEEGWTEVNGPGLKAGDTVVTVGAYGLPKQAQIQVVNSSADETSETTPSSSQAK